MGVDFHEGGIGEYPSIRVCFLDTTQVIVPYPQIVRENQVRKVAKLKLWSMMVDEYTTKILELSLFTPYLIPNKKMRAMRFEKGLNL